LEQNGVDHTVLIVGGLVGHTGDEPVDDKSKEKVLIVDIMQREHGAAVEQELRLEGLEAKVFERDAEGRLRAAGVGGRE
jgi:hypothetical protein